MTEDMELSTEDGSITKCFRKSGPSGEEIRFLWERYSRHLEAYVRNRLRSISGMQIDEQDVTQVVFCDLAFGLANCAFGQIASRGHFWNLARTIASRRLTDFFRKKTSVRAGGKHRICDTYELTNEPTQDGDQLLCDALDQLLLNLRDDQLRRIVLLRLQGEDDYRIALKLGISQRSVSRKMAIISMQLHLQNEEI